MLLLSEVMALMRLWDRKRTVQSIRTLAKRLGDPRVIDRLAKRERLSTADTRRIDVATLGRTLRKVPFSLARVRADQREQELKTSVSKWLADVRSVESCPEIARLKKCRHELLAHSAASSNVPNVQPMQYTDPGLVLDKTIPIVSAGYLLATGRYHDLSSTSAIWKDRQRDLWEIVRCAGRGEQFAPPPRTIEDLVRDLARLKP
jgi:hypothetical protein